MRNYQLWLSIACLDDHHYCRLFNVSKQIAHLDVRRSYGRMNDLHVTFKVETTSFFSSSEMTLAIMVPESSASIYIYFRSSGYVSPEDIWKNFGTRWLKAGRIFQTRARAYVNLIDATTGLGMCESVAHFYGTS